MTPRPLRKASVWQRAADHLFFPLNMWLGDKGSLALGLTPIDHERIRAALPHCRGRLLDVACGDNLLARSHGNGVGADIHPYPAIDVRCRASQLPFKDARFDTVALLACLNHIARRREAMRECRRVIRPEGTLVITMIPPWVGRFSHPIRKRYDPDQLERGIGPGEAPGMTTAEIRRLLEDSGFRLTLHRRFMWGLNNLYVARPVPVAAAGAPLRRDV
jgi:SAM-dependent methyltransferase